MSGQEAVLASVLVLGAAYHSLKSKFDHVCCHSVAVRIEDNAACGLVTFVAIIFKNSNDPLHTAGRSVMILVWGGDVIEVID